MTRQYWCVCALTVFAVVSICSPARADLQADFYRGRTDATLTATGYRNWASSAEGLIVSRSDQPISSGTSQWTIHPTGSAQAGTKGVAATGFTDSGNINEIVTYVGIDGKLNIGRVINGGTIAWSFVNPPIGKTLTGHLAVVTNLDGSNRFVNVGATTTDNKLYRFVMLLSLGTGSWTDSTGGLTWLVDNPLSASVGGTIVSIFAAHSPSTESLGMLRWNGSTWSTTNLGRPTGKRACRTITSAQGYLSDVKSSYTLLVACAPHNPVGEVYIATSGVNSTTFTWATFTTPGATVYQSLAAVHHSTGSTSSAIDIYATGLLTPTIHKLIKSSSGLTLTSLGNVPDGLSVMGLVSAVPSGTRSRAFFIGSSTGRRYLYERWGGSTTSDPSNYRALGEHTSTGLVGPLTSFLAEGKVSAFQGTVAASMLSRPTGGFPSITFLYSSNDGKTVNFPETITNVVDGTTYEYVTDPTAVVTDAGNMYSVQLGVDVGENCAADAAAASVYLVGTSRLAFPMFSAPIALETISNVGTGLDTSIDHPYSDIEHRVGQNDRVHVAWWALINNPNGLPAGIRYAEFVEGSTSAPTPVNVLTGAGGPPRVTASDTGRVIVYYPVGFPAGNLKMCELNSTRTACEFGWQTVRRQGTDNLFYSSPGVGNDVGVGVSGSQTHMRTFYPASMTVSERGDRLYYCFHQTENNGDGSDADLRDEVDVFCTTGTRDPVLGWTWEGPRVAVAGVTLDDRDQFAPEVIVTREGATFTATEETVTVTWYDRTDDSANKLYKMKRSVSTDLGQTYAPTRQLYGGRESDPEFLPRHCRNSNVRFLGDFAGAEGDLNHGHSLGVIVSNNSSIGTQIHTSFSSLGNWEK